MGSKSNYLQFFIVTQVRDESALKQRDCGKDCHTWHDSGRSDAYSERMQENKVGFYKVRIQALC